MSVQTQVSAPVADNALVTSTPMRSDGYSSAITASLSGKDWFLAAEGNYYTACSPTPGTGIIGHAAPTTFDETKPYLYVYNGHTTKSLYPQFLQLNETVASVGGVRVQLTMTIDTGNRYTSGGTAMTVNNTNMNSSNSATPVLVYQGAVIAAAASGSRRLVGNIVLRGGVIDIIQDFYQIVWGAPDGVSNSTSRVATVAEVSRTAPPLCVGPGQSMYMTQWVAAQSTGPTWEALFGFILR